MICDRELFSLMPLFKNIEASQLNNILDFLMGNCKHFQKNETVLGEGTTPAPVGLILKGEVRMMKNDLMGGRMIIGQSGTGQLFGNAVSCPVGDALPVSIVASTPCIIYFFPYERIMMPSPCGCLCHSQLISNFSEILAWENDKLRKKILHLSRRTTREKLLSYLFEQSETHESTSFEISFNRQELADYLCVDRSAMSTELSRLQQEHVISFQKNRFTILAGDKVNNHH